MCVCESVCVYVCVSVCVCLHKRACLFACIAHTYVRTHAHTYARIQTQTYLYEESAASVAGSNDCRRAARALDTAAAGPSASVSA